jgi:hypothetical protein
MSAVRAVSRPAESSECSLASQAALLFDIIEDESNAVQNGMTDVFDDWAR